ncbi:MAG: hypothetical protein ACYDG2_27030 [Ruminiclostridium sp.]
MKKIHLSILYVVMLSLLVSGAILLSKPAEKGGNNSKTTDNEKSNTAVVADNSRESVSAYKNEIAKNEIIKVSNNEADINLHANLIEDNSGQVSLCLTYNLNGKRIKKNIDTSNVAEIRNIFRFREVYGNGYRIDNMILNEKMNKLYFCVKGRKDKKYTHTSIYSYNLENSKIEKIIYALGDFSKFSFSPDGKYNAFSYLGSPQNTNYNEKTMVVIIRCSDNKLVLNSNEDTLEKLYKISDEHVYSNGDILEKQYDISNELYVYSYNFIKWKNNNICELSQRIKAKDDSIKVKEQTVYYNVISKKLEMK